MRILSLNMRAALASRESGEVGVFLLTITHPSTAEVMRMSSDPTQRITTDPLRYGTVSRGETFYYIGLQAQLPDEKDEATPQSRLMISNVERSAIPLIRSIDSPADALLELVLASDPDVVEIPTPLQILHVEFDAAQIVCELGRDGLTTASFPAGIFGPGAFPGLFA